VHDASIITITIEITSASIFFIEFPSFIF
jgi:hypothetical protein